MKTNLDGFYKSSKEKETEGVWYDLSETAGIKVKRFGGYNSMHIKALHTKYMKPFANQIKAGTLPPQKEEEITTRVFVESSVIDWKGIEIEDEVKEFNVEDCVKVFLQLPQLRDDLINFSLQFDNFKEDLGNS